jgi:pimeloyl-ACP methyl ester carboxylesterase
MSSTTRTSERSPPDTDDGVATARLDDGRRVAYAEYGDPTGRPVLFLHGTPGSRHLAALFDEVAREQRVRLLAPDRPGYGRSPPWPDRSIDHADAFVTGVLDDAGVDRAGLVAFSGGAPYALAAAAKEPDRIERVDLVSGATPPELTETTPAVQRLLAGLATTTPSVLGGLFRGQAWLAGRLDPSFVLAQYTADERAEPVPDAAAETVRADFVEAFAGGAGGAVTEFRETATEWPVDYAAIDVEVRLRHGERDTNVPIEGARRLEELIPTATLTTLDTDHLGALLRGVPDLLATGG